MALLVAQHIPEIVGRQRNYGQARGGAMTDAIRDTDHLLGPFACELESIRLAPAGQRARLWACLPISVKRKEWVQSYSCFLSLEVVTFAARCFGRVEKQLTP